VLSPNFLHFCEEIFGARHAVAAQIGNLLYRRIAFGGAALSAKPREFVAASG